LHAYERLCETELRQHNMRNLLDIQFDKAAGSANIDVANVILAVNSTDGQEKWHAGSAAECYL